MQSMIFMNIAWMKQYRGNTGGDRIISNTSFGAEYAGHEGYNFQPYQGYMYGFVLNKSHTTSIRIEEHFNAPANSSSVDGVLVIWTSLDPKLSKRVIVGWYESATLFRNVQYFDDQTARIHPNDGCSCPYVTSAKEEDCYLVPFEERTFKIDKKFRYIWYAKEDKLLRQNVIDYVENEKSRKKSKILPRTAIENRQKVEKVAIDETIAFYENQGYTVTSVELEKVGWDLTVIKNAETLRIEVKGTSQPRIFAEVTCNEYHAMKTNKDNYRICIITNALADPALYEFIWNKERDTWSTQDGIELIVEERTSARISAIPERSVNPLIGY